MDWLVASIALSVVLTVVFNLVLRAFPAAGGSIGRKLDELTDRGAGGGRSRVEVWFPWKGMIVASIVLTVVLNLLLWLR